MGITLLCQIFEGYERILANKIIQKIREKLEDLYAPRAGGATTDLIFVKMHLI
jgi:hypothetical protein